MCFKKVLKDLLIKKFDKFIGQCYIREISQQKDKKRKIWVTQKNTEVVEKWVLKKEEPEKKIRKSKFQLIYG